MSLRVLAVLGLVALSVGATFPDATYDPLVDELIQSVSADSVWNAIASISGEIAVTIDGEPDSIPTRYAYSQGSYRAALWLREQLEAAGLDAELVPFVPIQFRDADLLASGEGWACGWDGHTESRHGHGMFYTADAGASWEGVTTPDGYAWLSLVAISSDSVWCVDARGRIARTTDGMSWGIMRPGNDLALYDVAALGSARGWAVGDSGLIVSTDDAWETYTEDYAVLEDLRHVAFGSESRGWIASPKNLWSTDDGGESWLYLEHPMSEISGLDFCDSLRGYLLGRNTDGYGAVYATTDGGSSWYPLIDTLRRNPKTIKVLNPDTLWVAGGGGLLIHSTDAGVSWVLKQLPSAASINAIDFAADGRGAAVAEGDFFSSWDGETWNRSDTSGLGFMWNVVATHPGEDPTQVLITAHYDAISETPETYTPGADDNGSGVACVLEAARVLTSQDWKHTLRFVLFGGEEVGLFGSNRYVTEAVGEQDSILAVLNADMFAYDGNGDAAVDVNSNPDDALAQAAGNILMDVIEVYDVNLQPQHYIADAAFNSDHAWFWGYLIPAVFLGEDRNDRNPFYHSTNDRLSELNPEHIREGVRAAVGWMATMAELDSLVDVKEPRIPPAEIVSLRISSSIMRSQGWVEIGSLYPATVAVYDVSGRVAKNLGTIPSSQTPSRVSFDVSDLPSGVYWVRVKSSQASESKKFIVIH